MSRFGGEPPFDRAPATWTLAEALPQEILRCLEVRDVYLSLPRGAGQLGAASILSHIMRAQAALASGDVVDMVRAYTALKEVE